MNSDLAYIIAAGIAAFAIVFLLSAIAGGNIVLAIVGVVMLVVAVYLNKWADSREGR